MSKIGDRLNLPRLGAVLILAILAAIYGVAFGDMRHQFLFLLFLLDADNLGVQSILGRAINAGQSSKSDSSLEVVCSLQNIGDEGIKHDTEDGCICPVRVLFQGKGTCLQLGIDRKQNRIFGFLQICLKSSFLVVVNNSVQLLLLGVCETGRILLLINGI